MNRAPFPPLTPSADGLDVKPRAPETLRARMADVYGVPLGCIAPVRDAEHGLEIALHFAAASGLTSIVAASTFGLERLLRISRLDQTNTPSKAAVVLLTDPPQTTVEQATAGAGFVVVDERFAEYSDVPSSIGFAIASEAVIVLRSLTYAYGLAGAPCGAIIASPKTITALKDFIEPTPLATPVVRLAETVLDPSRMARNAARIDAIKAERQHLANTLTQLPRIAKVSPLNGPFIRFSAADAAVETSLRRFGVAFERDGDAFTVLVGFAPENARLLAALGASDTFEEVRSADVVRDTKETRIVACVDLTRPAPIHVDTGVGFFDHMLAQVAQHGGFSLSLTCRGDLEIDAHHTIEDCAIAFGQSLSKALGERRGIARFGFVLPMDETEAKVSIDLSGRPHAVFEGQFHAPLLGAYPTQMTAHVFQSLAQALGASIHIAVSGQNDHHMTEACFKAFGRALRNAIRIEGDAIPSTKGVL